MFILIQLLWSQETKEKGGKMTNVVVAKTARGAANATAKALNKEAVKMGASPTAKVRSETHYGITSHYVFWEEGPYEWTIVATGKGNIWGEEATGSLTKAYHMPATIDFKHGWESGKYFVECENSYTLVFGKN